MKNVTIILRPLTIDITVERQDIYTRVKTIFETCQTLINNNTDPEIRLRAMEVMGKLARVLKSILKDTQLDEIEAELEELEEMAKASKRI